MRLHGFLALTAFLALCSCGPAERTDVGTPRSEARELFGIVQAVDRATLSRADVVLGRGLFWDTRLSVDGKTACASCHQATDWGADRRRFSPDARGKLTSRNSQTVFNAVLQPQLRWTGDRKSGAHQAERSLTGSMGLASADALVPLLKSAGYEPAFKAAFGQASDPLTPANYAKAVEAYEATLVTPAPFDRFLSGEDGALSTEQKKGLRLFIDFGCADCHKGPLLGGTSLKKFGVAKDYWIATRSEKQDVGLFESSKNEADRYKFRVSMLRNVANTGPYFHDGAVAGLEEAVRVMADVQLGKRLADEEAKAITAFLESLTGEVPSHYAPPK